MKKFWISWESPRDAGGFELNYPWWITSVAFNPEGNETTTICAALTGDDEENVKEKIMDSYDERPLTLDFRFCSERPADWIPYCDRFRREKWMTEF